MMQNSKEFLLKYKYPLVLLIYFVLSIIGIYHHEVWLDEAQHFLLARDSRSFSDLFYTCRNEGHPYLWVILLYVITRFTANVVYMQLLHVFISCLTVKLICKSSLSFIEKLFIIFGLYFLYEYNIISRNYGMSACMLFLFIHNYIAYKERIILLACVLFLFANTHLFSLIISVAIVFTYMIINRDVLLLQKKRSLFIATGIILSGWAISVYCILPAPDYGIHFIKYDPNPYFSQQRILEKLSICLKGLFYLPDYTLHTNHFENSVFFSSAHIGNWMQVLLSLLSFLLPAYALKNNRFAFTLFFSFVLIFLPIYFFLPLNSVRYYGFFYMLFVACYWIARPQVSKAAVRISVLIFALQFVNGMFMYTLDLRYPFSESKNVTLYLHEIKNNNEPVLILNRESRLAISAYSGIKYFGVETGELQSYCLWQQVLPDSTLKILVADELKKNSTSLIISRGMPSNLLDTSRLTFLRAFDQGIIRGENVRVYRYNR